MCVLRPFSAATVVPRIGGSVLKHEGLQRGRHDGSEVQLVLADDSSAKAFQRGEVQRVDDLVNGLGLQLQQVDERVALPVDLVQVTALLQHHLHGARRARLGLRQNVQRRVSVLRASKTNQ